MGLGFWVFSRFVPNFFPQHMLQASLFASLEGLHTASCMEALFVCVLPLPQNPRKTFCFVSLLFTSPIPIGSIITGKIVNCRGQSLQNMLFFELICTWRPRLTLPSRTGSAFGYLFPSLALHSDESSFSCSLRHLTTLPPPGFMSLQNFRVSS